MKGRPNTTEWTIQKGEDIVRLSKADFQLVVRDEIAALFDLDYPQAVQIKCIDCAGVSFAVIRNRVGNQLHGYLSLPLIFRDRIVRALPPWHHNYTYLSPNYSKT